MPKQVKSHAKENNWNSLHDIKKKISFFFFLNMILSQVANDDGYKTFTTQENFI